MSFLNDHRMAAAEGQETFLLMPPFSFFDFVEDRFGDYDSIRRIFSLARASSAETLVLEQIQPCGIIAEENEDILELFPSYRNTKLLRLSFWKKPVIDESITLFVSKDLVGYALFKHDQISENDFALWHVFEAVFAKYPHSHNCVPYPQTYRLMVDGKPFEIKGLLYCQQNSLNKACAQVALRSLLSRTLPEGDISYRRINEIAATVNPGFQPGQGLNVPQMRKVLSAHNLRFNDIDYSQCDEQLRNDLPYQKYAYAGQESGGGALVGFRLAGRELREEAKHIIPIYGHTFNKDTWAPTADISYFRIGEGVGYVPSESWTSSFLGHDDNFGPNFCIPRLYIENDKVDYVVEIFRPGICYGGMQAEALALNILYSLLPSIVDVHNRWISRLVQWTSKQQIVFRAQAMRTEEYVSHLCGLRDWEGNGENPELCKLLGQEMPEFVWAVEVSTPQLFPANERKLGEIVLDATMDLDMQEETSVNEVFIFARLPGIYLLGGEISNGTPQFTPVPSQLVSHTDLIKS
jgi:hypothetical protein